MQLMMMTRAENAPAACGDACCCRYRPPRCRLCLCRILPSASASPRPSFPPPSPTSSSSPSCSQFSNTSSLGSFSISNEEHEKQPGRSWVGRDEPAHQCKRPPTFRRSYTPADLISMRLAAVILLSLIAPTITVWQQRDASNCDLPNSPCNSTYSKCLVNSESGKAVCACDLKNPNSPNCVTLEDGSKKTSKRRA
jgi:hypothetical protein